MIFTVVIAGSRVMLLVNIGRTGVPGLLLSCREVDEYHSTSPMSIIQIRGFSVMCKATETTSPTRYIKRMTVDNHVVVSNTWVEWQASDHIVAMFMGGHDVRGSIAVTAAAPERLSIQKRETQQISNQILLVTAPFLIELMNIVGKMKNRPRTPSTIKNVDI